MAHNLHGDIPKEHLELAAELEEMEEFFDSKKGVFEGHLIGKGYVCIAHDWYDMGDDDKGSLLLEKAERACPGYFNNEMYAHMAEDEFFAIVVKRLTAIILSIAGNLTDEKK